MSVSRDLWVCVVGIAIGSLCVSVEASDRYGYGRGSVHGEVTWETPDGVAKERGMYVLDAAPTGVVRRLLAFDPVAEWRAILTETLDPSRGLSIVELRDDRSDWWARGEIDFGVQEDSLGDYFIRAREELTLDSPDRSLLLRLTTSNGQEISVDVSVAGSEDGWATFFGEATATGQLREVAAGIPRDFQPAVLFLDRWATNWLTRSDSVFDEVQSSQTELVNVLAGAIHSADRGSRPDGEVAEARIIVRGPNQKGRGVVDPELLELTSRFRTIQNAEPLAGHYVEEVIASESRLPIAP